MKDIIPKELVTLYGIMAISRITAARTTATLKAMPEVQDALKKVNKDKKMPNTKSIGRLDVENGGMDQEFEDFMRDGFEDLIPGFGDWTVKPFPPIELPPQVVLCGKITRALNRAREERDEQRESAERLEALVNALSKNAHPLIVVFAALFKIGLQQVQDRLQELDDLINGLMRTGFEEGCF